MDDLNSSNEKKIDEDPKERQTKMNIFVQESIERYQYPELRDDDLWEIFQDDFKDWKLDDFETVPTQYLTGLRNQLRRRGVFIQKGRGFPIAQKLHETLRQENPLKWSESEIKEQLASDRLLFDSRHNPNWGNQNLLPPKPTSKPFSILQENIDKDFDDQKDIQLKRRESDEIRFKNNSRVYDYPPREQNLRQSRSVNENYNKSSDYTSHGNGRELSDLARSYTDEEKYSGSQDRFDFKLTIFKDICDRVRLPEDKWIRGLPIMLKGEAKIYYYQVIFPNINDLASFEVAVNKIKSNFEGPEYQRTALETWHDTTLDSLILDTPGKSLSENFEKMLSFLRDLQLGLAPRYRDEEFLYTKLLQACKKNPACELACFKPALTLEGLIADLRASVILKNNIKASQYISESSESFYTDRRYKSRHNNSPDYSRSVQSSSSNKNGQLKKCFICRKYGCWSSNHTAKEREQHRRKWQKVVQEKANHEYDQYLAEGYVSDNPEELSHSKIEALVNSIDLSEEEIFKGDTQETFFGEIDGKELFHAIADLSVQHAIVDHHSTKDYNTTEVLTSSATRYNDLEYHGIMIDTGAAAKSTAGYKQYLAYRRLHKEHSPLIDTSKGKSTNIKFGIGITTPIGTIGVYTPLGFIEFFIVKADTPFLLSLQDMDRLKVYFNNVENVLIQNKKAYPVVRRWGHPFIFEKGLSISNSSSSSFVFDCFLTSHEIRQLHRRFGHPSSNRLFTVLEKSGHNINRSLVEKLTKFCTVCQKHGRSPRRFKFSLKDDSLDFNHSVFVDIMYITSSPTQSQASPVLHVVDEATGFQAGRWLSSMSSQSIWNALRHCWIDTYSGPPDVLVHDSGTNFTSQEFQQSANSLSIQTKCAPVEAHHSIGIVERYHIPVRRAYECLREDIPELSKESILQMAFKATNDIAGPEGLIPTLLVFGCYPRMSFSDPPQPSISKRATAIKRAMTEASKIRISRKVTEALRQRNGPNIEHVKNLPINSDVLVWRDNHGSKRWEGPFKLLGIEGDTCRIELSSGPTEFRITSVKPFLVENNQSANEEEPTSELNSTKRRNPERAHRLPARFNDSVVFISAGNPLLTVPAQPWGTQIAEARRKELNDLLEKQVFCVSNLKELPQNLRIFGSKWVDKIKNEGTSMAFAKARLVIQGFNDSGKEEILTQSPTIQRASQRIILAIAAMRPDLNLYLRDISQAYVQSTTPIHRKIFVRPPLELGLENDKVLKIEKPLYGLAESGNHWYITYHGHHTKTLGMTPSTHDPCLLYKNNLFNTENVTTTIFGLSGLQTDDTLFLANPSFAELEQNTMTFLCKERELLTEINTLNFNGGLIQKNKNSILLSQKAQCGKIEQASNKNSYIAQRARGAYISLVCQPEAAFDLSFAAQIKDPQPNDINRLNKRLIWQKNNSFRGLKFIPLDIKTLKLVVFTDSSFATNPDFSSQLGYVITLVDGKGNANTLHWQSVKSKRVTKSVSASELYAISLGFDQGSALNMSINAILQPTKPIPLVICTDSRTIFDCLTRLNTVQEKRLMIDIMSLREAYEKREITEIKWIAGKNNPADALTKPKNFSQALQKLIDTNWVDLESNMWVEREE